VDADRLHFGRGLAREKKKWENVKRRQKKLRQKKAGGKTEDKS